MSEHYHDENDLKLMREMRKLAPDDFNAWLGLNNIVGRENGAIPKKYRELIAIAVSATTQCPYCMEAHAKAAHAAGASREEVVEAALIAAALRAGAAATHGTMALNFSTSRASQKKNNRLRPHSTPRLIVASFILMPLFSCAGTRPGNLGVEDSRLAPCPSSPNCVSSDDADAAHAISALQLALPPGEAWRAVQATVAGLPRDEDHHANR